FGRTKEMLRDTIVRKGGVDMLDIDADFAGARDRVQSHTGGMRNAEVQSCAFYGELSEFIWREFERTGIHTEIFPEQLAKQSAPGDEFPAMAVEAKLRGAAQFGIRQQIRQILAIALQAEAVELDVVQHGAHDPSHVTAAVSFRLACTAMEPSASAGSRLYPRRSGPASFLPDSSRRRVRSFPFYLSR